ncbi:MAG: M15 family metallopeptidase [Candidatus Omnitrophota bacterium]
MSPLYRLITVLLILSAAACGDCPGAQNPLIDVNKADPTIRVEVKYASADNFMKEILYPEARCLLLRPTAERLVRVQARLKPMGYCLKVFDGYRPLSVQKKMWERFPLDGFVANPAKGSNHNRGAAVDLTLTDLQGAELEMPSVYDEFSERAHRDYAKASPTALAHRKILEDAMTAEGFRGLPSEWWHFDDPDAKKYPILDLPLSDVEAAAS